MNFINRITLDGDLVRLDISKDLYAKFGGQYDVLPQAVYWDEDRPDYRVRSIANVLISSGPNKAIRLFKDITEEERRDIINELDGFRIIE